MTDKPTPKEIDLLVRTYLGDCGPQANRVYSFVTAVLAKWGQPAQAQAQAGAGPLTPDQIAEIADAAHREYDRLVSSGQCAPRWSAVFAHLLEMHHGIKGGQHGTE